MRHLFIILIGILNLLIIGKFLIRKQGLSGTITDIDGNIYHTIKIGKQTWMVENLKTTHLNNGKPLAKINREMEWELTKKPGYCWYDFRSENKEPWGAYYNWAAVNSGQLAPKGWHIPTKKDWEQLVKTLGGFKIAGGKLKEKGTTHWISPNEKATNSSRFSALPNGLISGQGFDFTGGYGCYFSSTKEGNSVLVYLMQNYSAEVNCFRFPNNSGLPVRCIKDN